MPLTLRELTHAAQGRLWSEWEQTAALEAMIANCHRDPKKKRTPYTAYDFFHRPGAKRPRVATSGTVDALHALKAVFTKGS